LRLPTSNPRSATVRGIVLLAVLATSFSSILIRLSDAAPVVIAAWRMGLAAMMTLPLAVRAQRREPTPTKPQRLTIVGAGVFLALHFAAWNSSLTLTSVAHATVLVSLHPLIVLITEIVSPSRRVPARKIAAIVVAVAGTAVLASGGSISGREPTAVGDGLAVLGAIAVSGYMVLGARVRRTIGTAQYTVRVYAVAAGILTIWAGIGGMRIAPLPPMEFAIFAALALVCTLLGHSLFNWAFRYLPASDVSVSILLEPLFASIMALFLFDELPGIRTIIGAVVVMISLAVVALSDRSR